MVCSAEHTGLRTGNAKQPSTIQCILHSRVKLDASQSFEVAREN